MNARRPDPFSAYTTPEFWNDPHISAQMLRAHLDPETDAASRRPDFIDRSVAWLSSSRDLDARVLDLGCGPGLYACRLARRGARVRGIDVSARSIAYARSVASKENLRADFVVANYLHDHLGGPYDLAMLLYEDYCVLSPQQRSVLLNKINRVLTPGGRFVMDVTSPARFEVEHDAAVDEEDLMGGFFAPPGYRGIHETWTYPDLRLVLDRFTIIEAGRTRQFWNWMQCLTPDQVAAELTAAGFARPDVYGDVAGAPYDPDSPTFAVVAIAEHP